MNFKSILITCFSGLVLLSCGNDEKTGRIESSIPDSIPPVSNELPQTMLPSQPSSPTMPTGAIALNPPHGEPGHRCDIEVGAPLNTPAGGGMQLNIPPPSATTGQRLNPAHGEPGHNCDIAVGAPLP